MQFINYFMGFSLMQQFIIIIHIFLLELYDKLYIMLSESQGFTIHVHLPIQAVVDDTEDGFIRPRHPLRNPILDCRGNRLFTIWGGE